MNQQKQGRSENYAATVNFEVRQQQRDYEQLRTQKLLALDSLKQDEENRPKTYNEYAGTLAFIVVNPKFYLCSFFSWDSTYFIIYFG